MLTNFFAFTAEDLHQSAEEAVDIRWKSAISYKLGLGSPQISTANEDSHASDGCRGEWWHKILLISHLTIVFAMFSLLLNEVLFALATNFKPQNLKKIGYLRNSTHECVVPLSPFICIISYDCSLLPKKHREQGRGGGIFNIALRKSPLPSGFPLIGRDERQKVTARCIRGTLVTPG